VGKYREDRREDGAEGTSHSSRHYGGGQVRRVPTGPVDSRRLGAPPPERELQQGPAPNLGVRMTGVSPSTCTMMGERSERLRAAEMVMARSSPMLCCAKMPERRCDHSTSWSERTRELQREQTKKGAGMGVPVMSVEVRGPKVGAKLLSGAGQDSESLHLRRRASTAECGIAREGESQRERCSTPTGYSRIACRSFLLDVCILHRLCVPALPSQRRPPGLLRPPSLDRLLSVASCTVLLSYAHPSQNQKNGYLGWFSSPFAYLWAVVATLWLVTSVMVAPGMVVAVATAGNGFLAQSRYVFQSWLKFKKVGQKSVST